MKKSAYVSITYAVCTYIILFSLEARLDSRNYSAYYSAYVIALNLVPIINYGTASSIIIQKNFDLHYLGKLKFALLIKFVAAIAVFILTCFYPSTSIHLAPIAGAIYLSTQLNILNFIRVNYNTTKLLTCLLYINLSFVTSFLYLLEYHTTLSISLGFTISSLIASVVATILYNTEINRICSTHPIKLKKWELPDFKYSTSILVSSFLLGTLILSERTFLIFLEQDYIENSTKILLATSVNYFFVNTAASGLVIYLNRSHLDCDSLLLRVKNLVPITFLVSVAFAVPFSIVACIVLYAIEDYTFIKSNLNLIIFSCMATSLTMASKVPLAYFNLRKRNLPNIFFSTLSIVLFFVLVKTKPNPTQYLLYFLVSISFYYFTTVVYLYKQKPEQL